MRIKAERIANLQVLLTAWEGDAQDRAAFVRERGYADRTDATIMTIVAILDYLVHDKENDDAST